MGYSAHKHRVQAVQPVLPLPSEMTVPAFQAGIKRFVLEDRRTVRRRVLYTRGRRSVVGSEPVISTICYRRWFGLRADGRCFVYEAGAWLDLSESDRLRDVCILDFDPETGAVTRDGKPAAFFPPLPGAAAFVNRSMSGVTADNTKVTYDSVSLTLDFGERTERVLLRVARAPGTATTRSSFSRGPFELRRRNDRAGTVSSRRRPAGRPIRPWRHLSSSGWSSR